LHILSWRSNRRLISSSLLSDSFFGKRGSAEGLGWRCPVGASGMQNPPEPALDCRHCSIESIEQFDLPSLLMKHQRCCALACMAKAQIKVSQNKPDITRMGSTVN